MSVPSAAAEVAIKKLARVGGNTICPNCGIEKKFGFGTVCMKYLTFVCNECKSSHQAISHRCKSLTMSSWTDGEIIQIRTTGGNDRARATWLAMAPPPGQNGRPTSGSSIDVYKSFIVEVYERKRYYREGTDTGEDIVPTSTPVRTVPVQSQRLETTTGSSRAPVPVPGPPPTTPAVQVVADLLDFGAFDSNPQPTVVSSSVSPSTNLFGEVTVSQPPTTTSLTPPTPIFDPFGTNTSTATAIPTSMNQAVDMFGTATTTNPSSSSIPAMTNSFGNFDPFSGNNGSSLAQSSSSSSSTTTAMMKPPIMNNAAMSSSSNIGIMMGNMNASNTIGGSIMMMNHPPTNSNGNIMMGNNKNVMGSTGSTMMNHYGMGNTSGTTNIVYGNAMNNNMYGSSSTGSSGMGHTTNPHHHFGMTMNGFPQSMNTGMMMMGNANSINNNNNNSNNMNMMMNNGTGMMPNQSTMMMNGFHNSSHNNSMMNQNNSFMTTMNGSNMGGNHSSTTAKNISSNFGNINKSQPTLTNKQHDPFANLGI